MIKKNAIIIASFCPDEKRKEIVKQSFLEIHNTGMPRDHYEIIIVNNGGIHEDLIGELDTDLVITNDKNIGQAAAFNQAIATTNAFYLALMDDDLSYSDGWLKYGMRLVRRHPCHIISLREYGKKYQIGETDDGYILSRKVGGVWMMNRTIYETVGPFGADYFDWGGLWTRNMRAKGFTFLVSRKPMIFHIGRKRSLTRTRGKWLRWMNR